MRPTLSYIVWTSQRTGSTLLCKALELTGIAGKPNELLTVGEPFDLFKMHEVDTLEALQRKLWELGTTSNGVFGLKLGIIEPHASRKSHVIQRLLSSGITLPVVRHAVPDNSR